MPHTRIKQAELDPVLGATGATGVAGATGVGVTGATGVAGSNGATGATGVGGVTGATGVAGVDGVTGATGVAGVTGATGVAGVTGATGVAGVTGATGVAGVTGATGVAGVTGATGVAGVTGATGVAGVTGATGVAGVTGATGVAGVTGATGAGATVKSVTQTSHGLSTGNAVYFDGANWQKAKADAATTLAIAIVKVTDANNFDLYFGGAITGLSGLTAGNYYFVSGSTAGSLDTTDPNIGSESSFSNPILFADSTTSGVVLPWRPSQGSTSTAAAVTIVDTPGLRLTGTTAVSVTTSDVSNITTLYYTPYTSGNICVYYNASWTMITTAEVSLALGTLTAAREYNVYAYSSDGTTLTLELGSAYTAGGAGAELTTQNGVLVKSGNTSRRYIGRIYTSSTTQTQDTNAQRFVSNLYNAVPRSMKIIEPTASWSFTASASFRQVRATSSNKFEFVSAEARLLTARASIVCSSSSTTAVYPGIGIDSTSTQGADISWGYIAANIDGQGWCFYDGYPSVGYHAINWLENNGNTTITCYGTTGNIISGMTGSILG